ncbi:MAG: hypothetical protein HC779_02030 [Phyllobacteriaceae bacterium]|nr:hypothetical protein [Phyllobacteriaceae bacterium]
MFGILARLKVLRGTPFDMFGRTAERRMERALLAEFEQDIDRLCAEISPASAEKWLQLAMLPQEVRGFGHVKERGVAAHARQTANSAASAGKAFQGTNGDCCRIITLN